ncbi:hypothetical protein CS063_00940 [Sporanaerobium hydrogeniformans]|uniref:Uncharacterized protein n=1 Tax=Sporanaerobium hydrogeniformans TaxID=3072179 RepID=A0AC61DFV5_9FIRM|nr:hypothetical protein CS063_00940 [Sporanaerobium hydrogeniformans]
MIAFWNRKEIYMGYSMVDFIEIRNILSIHQIRHTYKILCPFGGSGRRRVSFGVNPDFSHMYYIYIHIKDYEYVCKLIRDNR